MKVEVNIILRAGKRAAVVVDETIKWIGYLGLLAVASFAVWKIVSRVIG